MGVCLYAPMAPPGWFLQAFAALGDNWLWVSCTYTWPPQSVWWINHGVDKSELQLGILYFTHKVLSFLHITVFEKWWMKDTLKHGITTDVHILRFIFYMNVVVIFFCASKFCVHLNKVWEWVVRFDLFYSAASCGGNVTRFTLYSSVCYIITLEYSAPLQQQLCWK